jgi:hypothetical protein
MARNYWIDEPTVNADWLKAVPVIREAMGTKEYREKFGRFITIDDRVIFTGGPGAGAGGTGGGGSGRLPRATLCLSKDESIASNKAAYDSVVKDQDIYDYSLRSQVKDELVTSLSDESGVPYDEVNNIIGTWAATSNDEAPLSLAVQQEAAKVFGSSLSEWQQGKVAQWNEAQKLFPGDPAYQVPTSRSNIRKVLHTMYDQTQRQLEKDGVPEVVTLYRGVKNVKLPKGKTRVYSNTLSSFSANRQTSETTFSGPSGSLMAIQVPRSRIVGTCRTGFGCLSEYEFVVLGNNTGAGDEVWVLG